MRLTVLALCVVAATSVVYNADPKKKESKTAPVVKKAPVPKTEVKKEHVVAVATKVEKKGDCDCIGKKGDCDCIGKKPVLKAKGDCDCIGKKGDCDCIGKKQKVLVQHKKGDCDCIGKKGDCDCIGKKVNHKKGDCDCIGKKGDCDCIGKKPAKHVLLAKQAPKVVVDKKTVKVETVTKPIEPKADVKKAVEKAVQKAVAHLNKPVEKVAPVKPVAKVTVAKKVVEAPKKEEKKEKKVAKKAKKAEMSEATKKLYEESKKKHKALKPYGLKVEAPSASLIHHESKVEVAKPKEGASTIHVPEGQQEAMKAGYLHDEYIGDAKDHTKEKKVANEFPHHDQSEAFKKGFYSKEYPKDGSAAAFSFVGVLVAAVALV